MRLIGTMFLIAVMCHGSKLYAEGEENTPEEEVINTDSYLGRLTSGGYLQGNIELSVGEQAIPALFLKQTLGMARGVVLILHDTGEHMDSAAINGLRTSLPSYGWHTLSITLNYQSESPVEQLVEIEDDVNETTASTEADANTPPVVAEPIETVLLPLTNTQRLAAAITFIENEASSNIVIIGHGVSAQLATQALPLSEKINALVMLSADNWLSEEMPVSQWPAILEVYGDRQSPVLIESIKARQIELKNQDIVYGVRKINGANYSYIGTQSQLVKTVHSWLQRHLFESNIR